MLDYYALRTFLIWLGAAVSLLEKRRERSREGKGNPSDILELLLALFSASNVTESSQQCNDTYEEIRVLSPEKDGRNMSIKRFSRSYVGELCCPVGIKSFDSNAFENV